MQKPVIGISQCLLGMPVRHDGGHKKSRFCTDVLSELVTFRSFCPEMSAGFGVPRQTIRLVQRGHGVRVEHANGSGIDVTDALDNACLSIVNTLSDVDGVILTPKSPSCGRGGIKVYHPAGHPVGRVAGRLPLALMNTFPDLPIEDTGRLQDDGLRENFMMRVFLHHEWRTRMAPTPTAAGLVAFHTRHKFMLMAHSPNDYRTLGRLVAQQDKHTVTDIAQTYFTALMTALSRPASRQHHCNALQHLQGYVKTFMTPSQKQEMAAVIDSYRQGHVPLIVPVTLIRHVAAAHPTESRYLTNQSYLDPYPAQLGLRNAI